MPSTARTSTCLSAAAASLALICAAPRQGRAEDLLSYKYSSYREANGRVDVLTQSAVAQKDLGTDTLIRLTGTDDAIAGASPNGVPAVDGSGVPVADPNAPVTLSPAEDHRKAWSADLIHQFSGVNLDGGFSYSREHDYTSYGWSLNSLTDFNQKNTTLLVGAAGTEDYVKVLPVYAVQWHRKHSGSAIVGITQLLDPQTSLTFNISWERMTGFLNDQYKLVFERLQIFPGIFLPQTFVEARPNWRDKGVGFLDVNHAFEAVHGAVEASYRFYRDSYGTTAHTVELAWLQSIGEHLILEPNLRFYQQDAARFYYYILPDTVVPVRAPNGRGPFYSSDYRLSALRSYDYGIKAIWKVARAWQADLAFDDYEMQGRDHVTSYSEYPHAKITTAGIQYSW